MTALFFPPVLQSRREDKTGTHGLIADIKPHHEALKRVQKRINDADDALIDAETAADEVAWLTNKEGG